VLTTGLSDFGIRALSKYHEQHPYNFNIGGLTSTVKYLPGESDSGMFGGDSNWRGPIWMPVNVHLFATTSAEKIQKYGKDALHVKPSQ
jgi:hypothetical protein